MFKFIIELLSNIKSWGTSTNSKRKTQCPLYSDNFSCNINLITDTATIALFDPKALTHRINDECDWWVDSQTLPEVHQGNMTIIGLGGDGLYKIRVTSQDLTEDEKDFAKYVTQDSGVHVMSGKIFIGAGEEIPGGELTINQGINELSECGGGFIKLPNGDYTIRVYGIEILEISGEPTPEYNDLNKTLPDVVIQILPGKAPISYLKDEPILFNDPDKKYLFNSNRRATMKKMQEERNRLRSGSILHGKINKLPPSTLVLREDWGVDRMSWPSGYEVIIDDWKDIKWKDKLVLKVTSIDKKNKVIHTDVEEIVREEEGA